MEIILIRHAQKEIDTKNPSLTNYGIEQANFLSKRFLNNKFDEFYCSKKARSIETANILSKSIGISPEQISCLNEFYMGVVSNEYESKEIKDYTLEKLEELKTFLSKITENTNRDCKIIIVAHGLTNRLIMAILLNLDLDMKLIRFWQDETGVNIFSWSEKFNNWRVKLWNDTSHLN